MLGIAVPDIVGMGSTVVDVVVVDVGGIIVAVVVPVVTVVVVVVVVVGLVPVPVAGGLAVFVVVPVVVPVDVVLVDVVVPVDVGGVVPSPVPVAVELFAVLLVVPRESMFGSVDSPQFIQNAAEAKHSGMWRVRRLCMGFLRKLGLLGRPTWRSKSSNAAPRHGRDPQCLPLSPQGLAV